MNESEKIDLILSELRNMKSDMTNMKSDMQDMKSDMQNLHHRMTSLELHIENITDKNQASPAADKNLAYEVKVNYLLKEFEKLKTSVAQ